MNEDKLSYIIDSLEIKDINVLEQLSKGDIVDNDLEAFINDEEFEYAIAQVLLSKRMISQSEFEQRVRKFKQDDNHSVSVSSPQVQKKNSPAGLLWLRSFVILFGVLFLLIGIGSLSFLIYPFISNKLTIRVNTAVYLSLVACTSLYSLYLCYQTIKASAICTLEGYTATKSKLSRLFVINIAVGGILAFLNQRMGAATYPIGLTILYFMEMSYLENNEKVLSYFNVQEQKEDSVGV